MTATEPNADDADKSTGADRRQLNVTGFGGLDEPPTLELAPTTKRAEIDVDVTPGGVSLLVDVYAPGGVRTRTPAELFPEQARQLRDALDAALAEVNDE